MFNKSLKAMEGYDKKKKRNQTKILIDINLIPKRPEILGEDNPKYVRRQHISYEPTSKILRKGYTACIGLLDSLDLYGIPVYVKFIGFHKCDYRNGYISENGKIVSSEDPGAYS